MASGQISAINCYDSNGIANSYYPILTKFVNLNTKQVIAQINIASEGEIVNIYPAQITVGQDTLLVSAVNTRCYCKNTSVGDYNCHIAIINKITQKLEAEHDFPHQIFTSISSVYPDTLLINGSLIEDGHNTPIDGFYILGKNLALEKAKEADIYVHPNTIRSLDSKGLAYLINDNIYYDIYDLHYYIIKANLEHNVMDTLRLENYEGRNAVFAALDSVLYVFSLNYETRFKGRVEKVYGQGWIDANVRMFNIRNFALLDSQSIPDYPEDDFVSGSYGVGEISGPYITYYFGEAGDMEILYPAMLFIFDTRTNEATWLRVGWR